ncbi:MAG: S1 RNA-binding domain-containing protein [Microgenomates group bacterium]
MPTKKTATKKTATATAKSVVEKEIKVKKTMSGSMADLLSKNSFKPPKKGSEIEGKIIAITKKSILFDIGWKSYAVLGQLEAADLSTYLPFFKVSDTVKVRVVVEESKEGYPVVSMRKFFEKGKWDILEEKQKGEEEIDVLCGDFGKGGIFIEFMGIRGVIPKIQLTKDFINNPEKLRGQKVRVKVLEVDRAKNRLVVSQKASVLGLSYKDLHKEFDNIKVGEKYKATIIGFTEFGVFCEVGNIEGLIHISEISWKKISDPKTHLKEGETIDVIVVEKNLENFKLNLSIKRLSKDPWDDVEKKYPTDKEFSGELIRREKYGYIVRLEPGIEGLIHISKITNDKELPIGDTIKVYVEKVDTVQRRMSLILLPHEKPVVYR